jgi:hypothetical protein
MSVRDSSLREIVRRELYVDTITHQDTNAVSPHAARDRCEDDMLAIVDLYLKKSVWLFVHYDTG